MSFQKVKLRKDKDYVYCYLKKKIIEEEDCDHYEYNLECDKNNDIFKRTHLKGSNYGTTYAEGDGTPILNNCSFCLDILEEYDEYYLPDDVTTADNGLFDKVKKIFF